ncbi:MAG: class I SAM-dependent methyltransferase [Elusimicrobia bacterium]|nr:class I SAM-dependent methyltransferase [Elusimicrobiota bacterium]
MTDPETVGFFDRQAPEWDAHDHSDAFRLLPVILARAGIVAEDSVLDVGAGTGILVPFLEMAGVRRMAAVDASGAMVREYRKKFPGRRVDVADFGADPLPFGPESFTKVVVFNSFPHFREEPARLFRAAFELLAPAGRLIICHSMNRAALNRHHRRAGREVAGDVLIPDEEIERLYGGAGFIRTVVEDGGYFYSSGDKPGASSPRPART